MSRRAGVDSGMLVGLKLVVRAVFACCAVAFALDVGEALAAKPGYVWYVDFGWVTFVAYVAMAAVVRLRGVPAAGAFAAVSAAALAHALFGPLIVVDVFNESFGRRWQSTGESMAHALVAGVVAAALGTILAPVWTRLRPSITKEQLRMTPMMGRTLLVLAVVIVALDAGEALVSRASGTPYAWFMIVQIAVYAAIGFVLRRRGMRLGQTAIAVAVTSLVEATAGEWVALATGAAPPTPLAVQLFVVPIVIGFDVALACLGFAFAGVRFQRRGG